MLTLDFFGCSGSSCRKGLKFHHPSNKQGTLLISIFELLGWVDLTKSGDFFFADVHGGVAFGRTSAAQPGGITEVS